MTLHGLSRQGASTLNCKITVADFQTLFLRKLYSMQEKQPRTLWDQLRNLLEMVPLLHPMFTKKLAQFMLVLSIQLKPILSSEKFLKEGLSFGWRAGVGSREKSKGSCSGSEANLMSSGGGIRQ